MGTQYEPGQAGLGTCAVVLASGEAGEPRAHSCGVFTLTVPVIAQK